MKAPTHANFKVVTRINNIDIVILNHQGKNLVPLKPICEALGIAWQSQHEKLKSNWLLKKDIVICKSLGSDGKTYNMVCLPYMYIFGWIFTINPKNVKPEAEEVVSKYKMECYDAFFSHYTLPLKKNLEILDKRFQQLVDEDLSELDDEDLAEFEEGGEL